MIAAVPPTSETALFQALATTSVVSHNVPSTSNIMFFMIKTSFKFLVYESIILNIAHLVNTWRQLWKLVLFKQ